MVREVGKKDLDSLIVTETMHERKKVMIMNADAVVVLPGGAGTLDELFEALTWRQLGLHDKPIFILNTEGYWTTLMQLLNELVDSSFAGADLLSMLREVGSVEALGDALSFIAASRGYAG